jgi:poly-beta-1,6-N-acetyl-D-glucosamine synthase
MSCASILFWISLLYTLYIIGFYPLFVSWMARVRPMPVRRGPHTPSVSVIIATYNGEHFLKDKLDSVFYLDYPQELIQVIVVNDGSSDGTRQVAESYGSRIMLINSERRGKAGALNQGMAQATGEILVFTDVRQRLAPESLMLLMENFADPAVGTASAELQILAGSTSEEADTGTYYAVRRELAIPIPRHTLNDDMYLPLHAFFLGYRLIVDDRAKMYDYPTTLSAEFSRKVRTLAGNYQIIRYYPQLLGPKDRLLFHFLSYKLGRLLLPFALLVCAVSSLLAGGGLTVVSLVGQIGLYSAAVLDPRITPHTLLKRITSPIRSFLVMMIAALCAVSIWFVPPERFWKTTRVSRQNASPGNRT